jgi:hypothetical protein
MKSPQFEDVNTGSMGMGIAITMLVAAVLLGAWTAQGPRRESGLFQAPPRAEITPVPTPTPTPFLLIR